MMLMCWEAAYVNVCSKLWPVSLVADVRLIGLVLVLEKVGECPAM